ncbi:hypothetical protein ABZ714_01200 [Streptomyces sp. NPDC006798]|uniref:hypothetical protein n=1 Tax=Streptomyces sp. NPDC006798 TaxID=3155462 RepID=UPI0033D29621
MNRYATTVRRWWAVPPALLVFVLVCRTAGDIEVPVPSINGAADGARLDLFAPLIVVAAAMYCLDRRLPDAEATAVVPVRLLDGAALLLTTTLTQLTAPLVGQAVTRNVALLLAVAVLARKLAHEATATLAALATLLLTLLAGRPQAWWALPLYPPGSLTAWLATATLFGSALWSTTARRPRDCVPVTRPD